MSNQRQQQLQQEEDTTEYPSWLSETDTRPPCRMFLAPRLYQSHPLLIKGLVNNNVFVQCHDFAKQSYTDLWNTLRASCTCYESPLMCLVLEDTPAGVVSARKSNMTVIAIGPGCQALTALDDTEDDYVDLEEDEDDHLIRKPHAVVSSLEDLCQRFAIARYHQYQYLPYLLHLRRLAHRKLGYPIGFADMLYVETTDDDEVVHEDKKVAEACDATNENPDTIRLSWNGSTPLIPRQVFGVAHNSLANCYSNNIGWPHDCLETFHLDTRELERDIIQIMARYYRIDQSPYGTQLQGYVTSGGTEGNFCGLWWQRDTLKYQVQCRRGDDIETCGKDRTLERCYGPDVMLVTSTQTHYSIFKVAQQLQLPVQTVPVDPEGALDCRALETLLEEWFPEDSSQSIFQGSRPSSILMSVTLGTTQTGALDNLPKIHALLQNKLTTSNIPFSIHVDAALLGAILPLLQNPFADDDGRQTDTTETCTDCDYFGQFGVKTMAISGHKFFGSNFICGICLTTREFLRELVRARTYPRNPHDTTSNVAYVAGLHDITPGGSRSGFQVLSLHNTLCCLDVHTDCRRMRQIVNTCYENIYYLINGLQDIVPVDLIVHPRQSLAVCFPRPSNQIMKRYFLMPVTGVNKRNKITETVSATYKQRHVTCGPGMTQKNMNVLRNSNATPFAGIYVLTNLTREILEQFLSEYARDFF